MNVFIWKKKGQQKNCVNSHADSNYLLSLSAFLCLALSLLPPSLLSICLYLKHYFNHSPPSSFVFHLSLPPSLSLLLSQLPRVTFSLSLSLSLALSLSLFLSFSLRLSHTFCRLKHAHFLSQEKSFSSSLN